MLACLICPHVGVFDADGCEGHGMRACDVASSHHALAQTFRQILDVSLSLTGNLLFFFCSALFRPHSQPPTAGAYGDDKPINDQVTGLWGQVTTYDGYASSGMGGWENARLISYTSQVVAGTNYKVKVDHEAGSHVVTIFVPLTHTRAPPSITKTEALP